MTDFFLVGAPKAGTTSLYDYLSQHPNIFVPAVKEPNFYIEVGPQSRNVINILDKVVYEKLYRDAKIEQLKGDFSVSYLHGEDTSRRIYEENPSAKIIMVIRNPVNRAFSHWLMDIREGFTKDDFIKAFNNDVSYTGKRGFCYNSMYYDCGLYGDAIEKYQSYFKDVLVLVYEDLFTDVAKQISKIYDFLDIEDIASNSFSKKNVSGVVRNPVMAQFYHNTTVRLILKYIVPKEFKDTLRSFITSKNEQKITNEEYKLIYSFFEDDIKKVRQLVKNPELWKKEL
jgi:hypothetical protein